MANTSSEQTGDKKTEQEVLVKWHFRKLLEGLGLASEGLGLAPEGLGLAPDGLCSTGLRALRGRCPASI